MAAGQSVVQPRSADAVQDFQKIPAAGCLDTYGSSARCRSSRPSFIGASPEAGSVRLAAYPAPGGIVGPPAMPGRRGAEQRHRGM